MIPSPHRYTEYERSVVDEKDTAALGRLYGRQYTIWPTCAQQLLHMQIVYVIHIYIRNVNVLLPLLTMYGLHHRFSY